jgi:hypothetical protein
MIAVKSTQPVSGAIAFLTEEVATAYSAATTESRADAGTQSAQAAQVLLSMRGSTIPPLSDLEKLPSVPEDRAAGVVSATVQDRPVTRAGRRVVHK